MTITAEQVSIEYVGNGTLGPFPIPAAMWFQQDSDILVILTETATGIQTTLTLGADYTLTGAGDPTGGALTLQSAWGADRHFTIINNPDALQQVDLPITGKFPSTSVEQALDKLTRLVQRLRDRYNRTVRQPDGDDGAILALPARGSRKGKYLYFDAATGDPIAAAALTPGALIVSAYIETLLNDATALDARNTLGGVPIKSGAESISGDWAFQGQFSATGKILFGGITVPAQITANQNDYGLGAGGATCNGALLDSNSTYNITGLANPAVGRIISMHNRGSFILTFTNQDAASSANNRFEFGGANILLLPGETLVVQWMPVVNRWVNLSHKPRASTTITGLTSMADSAAVKAGASAAVAITPIALRGAFGLSELFVSAGQTISAAGALTLAHGFTGGHIPNLVRLVLVCTTAELGYAIGERLELPAGVANAANRGVSITCDATNVYVKFGSDAAPISIIRKDTGASAQITLANWVLGVFAWG